LVEAARACCDFYIQQASALDGICYWDTGAPQLHRLGDWQSKPADPYNDYEPVDASASAIAAQGLIRLGHVLGTNGEIYTQAGLTIAARLLEEPYLSLQPDHEGLLLHSIYHRPNGWDHIPPGLKIPCGESSMWGDYHLLELCLLISSIASSTYYTFFGEPE
jgi:unsaturated chondroitin disaccharide hydrolase